MKLVTISDTHSMHNKIEDIPDGDVLIHAGDLCGRGRLADLNKFLKWFSEQPHKHKIFIAGNHDKCLMLTPEICQVEIEKYSDIVYLEDSGVKIEGVRFWGSPWTPKFLNWYFMVQRGEQAKRRWDQIPDDTNILITHGPPYGILDETNPYKEYPGGHVGCEELLKSVKDRVKPKYHIFGHIHEGYGKSVDGETVYVNTSTCTASYEPINPPIVLEI